MAPMTKTRSQLGSTQRDGVWEEVETGTRPFIESAFENPTVNRQRSDRGLTSAANVITLLYSQVTCRVF